MDELKVTGTPEQILVVAVLIEIVGVVGAVTVMVMPFDTILLLAAQLILDVRTQVIMSPFARVLLEYVEAFVPTLLPLIFH